MKISKSLPRPLSESPSAQSSRKPSSTTRPTSFRQASWNESDYQPEGSSKKVKEASPHLLELTSGLEHAKWKGPPSTASTTSFVRLSNVHVSERLLEPTAANENGRYRKTDNDVDPRELGWKKSKASKEPKAPSSSSSQSGNDEPARAISASAWISSNLRKVTGASERLLTPTATIENSRWRSVSPGMRDIRSSVIDDGTGVKKIKVRPLSMNEHFLVPTTAAILASVKAFERTFTLRQSDPNAKKVKEPSAHLLEPTLNNQVDHWKIHPKPTAEPVAHGNHPLKKKTVDYYCKCVACTLLEARNKENSSTTSLTSSNDDPSSIISKASGNARNISEYVLQSNEHLDRTMSPPPSTRKLFTSQADNDEQAAYSSELSGSFQDNDDVATNHNHTKIRSNFNSGRNSPHAEVHDHGSSLLVPEEPVAEPELVEEVVVEPEPVEEVVIEPEPVQVIEVVSEPEPEPTVVEEVAVEEAAQEPEAILEVETVQEPEPEAIVVVEEESEVADEAIIELEPEPAIEIEDETIQEAELDADDEPQFILEPGLRVEELTIEAIPEPTIEPEVQVEDEVEVQAEPVVADEPIIEPVVEDEMVEDSYADDIVDEVAPVEDLEDSVVLEPLSDEMMTSDSDNIIIEEVVNHDDVDAIVVHDDEVVVDDVVVVDNMVVDSEQTSSDMMQAEVEESSMVIDGSDVMISESDMMTSEEEVVVEDAPTIIADDEVVTDDTHVQETNYEMMSSDTTNDVMAENTGDMIDTMDGVAIISDDHMNSHDMNPVIVESSFETTAHSNLIIKEEPTIISEEHEVIIDDDHVDMSQENINPNAESSSRSDNFTAVDSMSESNFSKYSLRPQASVTSMSELMSDDDLGNMSEGDASYNPSDTGSESASRLGNKSSYTRQKKIAKEPNHVRDISILRGRGMQLPGLDRDHESFKLHATPLIEKEHKDYVVPWKNLHLRHVERPELAEAYNQQQQSSASSDNNSESLSEENSRKYHSSNSSDNDSSRQRDSTPTSTRTSYSSSKEAMRERDMSWARQRGLRIPEADRSKETVQLHSIDGDQSSPSMSWKSRQALRHVENQDKHGSTDGVSWSKDNLHHIDVPHDHHDNSESSSPSWRVNLKHVQNKRGSAIVNSQPYPNANQQALQPIPEAHVEIKPAAPRGNSVKDLVKRFSKET